jgi:hypothetical protein
MKLQDLMEEENKEKSKENQIYWSIYSTRSW